MMFKCFYVAKQFVLLPFGVLRQKKYVKAPCLMTFKTENNSAEIRACSKMPQDCARYFISELTLKNESSPKI